MSEVRKIRYAVPEDWAELEKGDEVVVMFESGRELRCVVTKASFNPEGERTVEVALASMFDGQATGK